MPRVIHPSELVSSYALHGVDGYPSDRESAENCIRKIKMDVVRGLITEMASNWPGALDEFEAGEVCDWLYNKLDGLSEGC